MPIQAPERRGQWCEACCDRSENVARSDISEERSGPQTKAGRAEDRFSRAGFLAAAPLRARLGRAQPAKRAELSACQFNGSPHNCGYRSCQTNDDRKNLKNQPSGLITPNVACVKSQK